MPHPTAPDRSTGFYAPALDGLRWFAVLAVMLAHFGWTIGGHIDLGSPGVRLFFVLSGFLITHLLLRERAQCDAGRRYGAALGKFFVRRAFRLWPLYFASLAVAYVFAVDGTASPFAWHGFFATNHYIYHTQNWPALLSHYWTLAVEQQFYLVWPFALMFLPLRWLPTMLVALIVVGPLARWLSLFLGWSGPMFSYVLLPACLDFFALGGGVALLWREQQLTRLGSRTALRLALAGTVLWIAAGAWLRSTQRIPYYWTVYDASLQGIGFSLLLAYVLRFTDGRLAAFLRFRPFVYLGLISYGLYIWHNLMHRFGPPLLRHITGESYFRSEAAHAIFFIALTIVVSVVSYHFLEMPMRHLGQRLASCTVFAPAISRQPAGMPAIRES